MARWAGSCNVSMVVADCTLITWVRLFVKNMTSLEDQTEGSSETLWAEVMNVACNTSNSNITTANDGGIS